MTERGRPGRCNLILVKAKTRYETSATGIIAWERGNSTALVIQHPGTG